MPDECIDFIYIDPPFFTRKKWVLNGKSFNDKWPSVEAYLDWLTFRINHMERVLKKTGSIVVHLDWHASHYVKVEMDKIFGYNNLFNEITWERTKGSSSAGKQRCFPKNADNLLCYSKSKKYTFNQIYIDDRKTLPPSITKAYRHNDNDGKGLYRSNSLSAPSNSPSLKYSFMGYHPPKNGWLWKRKRMEQAYKDGLLVFNKTTIRQKIHLSKRKGMPITSIWTDIWKVQGGNKPVSYTHLTLPTTPYV